MAALHTTTVRVMVRGPDGAVPPGARVVADLVGANLFPVLGLGLDDGIVIPSRIEGTASSTGEVLLGLWPNTRGQGGTQYRISMFTAAGGKLADILALVPEAPAGTVVDLNSIAGLPVPAPIYGLLPLQARVAALEALIAELIEGGGGTADPEVPENAVLSNGRALVSATGAYVTYQ